MTVERKGGTVTSISEKMEGPKPAEKSEFLSEEYILSFLAGYPEDSPTVEDIAQERANFFIKSQGSNNKRKHIIVLWKYERDENGSFFPHYYYPKRRRGPRAPHDIQSAYQKIEDVKKSAWEVVMANRKKEVSKDEREPNQPTSIEEARQKKTNGSPSEQTAS